MACRTDYVFAFPHIIPIQAFALGPAGSSSNYKALGRWRSLILACQAPFGHFCLQLQWHCDAICPFIL